MAQRNLSPEQKLQSKMQSLLAQQKALEQKQAHLLYQKCKALMKEEFQVSVLYNLICDTWMHKTPAQLQVWRRPTESGSSKTHAAKSENPKASDALQKQVCEV